MGLGAGRSGRVVDALLIVVATRLANGGASGREPEGACERRMAKEGKKKALYNASKVRSFHAAAGADTSIV